MTSIHIYPGRLDLATLRSVVASPVTLTLDRSALPAIAAAVETVDRVIAEGRTVYGINTCFGLLAQTRIAPHDLRELQRSIVLSHAAGVGAPLSEAAVRLMMVLKINSLARGFSGVRLEVIESLTTLVNANILPIVPSKGSVGASGDLAPLAHMSCLLLGEGLATHKG